VRPSSMILALVAVVALGSASPEEPSSPLRLSVDEAVALALKQADLVKISRFDLEAVEGQIIAARSIALPKLSLQSSFSRQTYGHLFGGSSFGSAFSGSLPGRAATTDFYRADLVLSQAIYLGGRGRASIRAARIGRDLALAQIEDVTEDVVFALKSAYYRVLMERELVKVAQVSSGLTKRHLKDAIDQRGAGVATDFEVLRARVRSRAAETDLVRARNSLELARSTFARALGLPPGTRTVLTDGLEHRKLIVDESSLHSDALQHRAALKVAAIMVRGTEVMVQLARAERKPQLTFDATIGGGTDHDLLDHSNFEDDWTFGLRLTVPIFDGLSSSGKMLEENAKLDQARAQFESRGRDVRLDVHQALLSLSTANDLVDAQKESVAEAARAYELAEIRFQAGQVKQLVVFDAQAELANARRSYYQAVFEHMVAAAQIERAAGTFTPPETAKDQQVTVEPATPEAAPVEPVP